MGWYHTYVFFRKLASGLPQHSTSETASATERGSLAEVDGCIALSISVYKEFKAKDEIAAELEYKIH